MRNSEAIEHTDARHPTHLAGDSYGPAVSADGRYVAFETTADNLVDDDTKPWFDVFVHLYGVDSPPPTPTSTTAPSTTTTSPGARSQPFFIVSPCCNRSYSE